MQAVDSAVLAEHFGAQLLEVFNRAVTLADQGGQGIGGGQGTAQMVMEGIGRTDGDLAGMFLPLLKAVLFDDGNNGRTGQEGDNEGGQGELYDPGMGGSGKGEGGITSGRIVLRRRTVR